MRRSLLDAAPETIASVYSAAYGWRRRGPEPWLIITFPRYLGRGRRFSEPVGIVHRI